MSTTLSLGPVSVAWPWTYQLVAVPANITSSGPWNYQSSQLTNGTGAGQADVLYTAQLSLAGAGTNTINLSAVTNAFGTSVSFARLKALYFENNSGGSSTGLAIGGAGVNPFVGGLFNAGTDTITLRNGVHMSIGVCADATGYAVGTGVNLLLTNADGTNSAKVNVGLAGASV